MNRRELLTRGGIAIGTAGLVGGCTEDALKEAEREPPFVDGSVSEEEVDLPVEQRLGVAADGIERAEGADIADLAALDTYLLEGGVAVHSIEETRDEHDDEVVDPELGVEAHEPLVAVAYVTAERAGVGLVQHLGVVAGGYAALVAAGHDSAKLEATLLGRDERPYGLYEVRRPWASAYVADELTAREYAAEVLESAETA